MLAALLLNLVQQYPALDQHVDTRVVPIGGAKVQAAPNGVVDAQARYGATVYQILSVHDKLTLDERDALIGFYASNARQAVSWTAAESGITYDNCIFAGNNAIAWVVKRVLRETRFRVEVRMLTSVS